MLTIPILLINEYVNAVCMYVCSCLSRYNWTALRQVTPFFLPLSFRHCNFSDWADTHPDNQQHRLPGHKYVWSVWVCCVFSFHASIIVNRLHSMFSYWELLRWVCQRHDETPTPPPRNVWITFYFPFYCSPAAKHRPENVIVLFSLQT